MQQDGSREQERLSVKTTYDDSQTVWEEKTAVKVLRITSDGLLKDLNYLGFALNSFEYKPDRRLVTSATDGQYLYFSPTKQLELFKKNSVFLSRLYLHSVLHCLFSHLWLRGSRDERLWSAACDICVEYVIDKLDKPSVRRTITLVRQQVYEEFEKSGKAVSAAVVYRCLEGLDAKRIDVIAGEFFADDHVFWPKENKLSQKEIALMKNWQKAGDQVNKKRTSGEGDDDGEALAARQIQAGKTRKSYRAFLQEFMVMHEELQTDPDEFDIGYYMYGLSIYKNMPLIEPVETKETKRIEDFAVVIDTSYSTDGELVKSFLRETFGILKSRDSFFRKGKVHLIQADDKVRSDILIEDEKQIDRLMSEFELKGGGNTDFRPAFEYVSSLVEDGSFENLSGLLYFTDGRGIYPKKEPPYKTAFLFMEPYDKTQVPVWAMQFLIDEEELKSPQNNN